ncbi:hypothetical protein VI33_03405 [Methylophilales bacterium MBRS-H7]|uniref:Uncharacterized protein n=1 Tax=Methylophilales bacterium MBRS-H7 TaxID=1623450 RepID=A0A0H4IZ71_9PROT|nr:hypothetical protein VI33_03405 [Methylophilales bacterium MBRS-H7]
MEHNFWSRLGGFVLLISLGVCFWLGFKDQKWLWVIAILPSYLLGFYLYRIINGNHLKIEFFRKIYFVIIASIITLSIIYYIGLFFNIILDI